MDGKSKKLFMTSEINFLEKFGSNLSQNVKLSNYSWFNLGGNAEYFYKANSKDQLKQFLKEANNKKLKITILGAGSNTLFRDNGVRGVVVKLGKDFSYTKLINEKVLEVGAATLDRKVANFAMENHIGNLEFLSCIPGSIGGAITMNSGCYNNDISNVLESIKVLDINELNEIEIKKENIKFLYRGTNLSKELIILSAKLKGLISKKKDIEKKQDYLMAKKKTITTKQNKNMWEHF